MVITEAESVPPGAQRDEVTATERALMALWPALESIEDGSWLWRFAEGLSGRANSLNCLDPDDQADAEARLKVHVDRYRQRGIVPTVRVTPLTANILREMTSGPGWAEQGHTVVMSKSIGPAQPIEVDFEYGSVADLKLTSAHNALRHVSERDAGVLARMMQKVRGRAETILLRDAEGEVAAGCLAISEGKLAGLFSIITRADLRRQGYARKLLASAEQRLREIGITSVALQVEAGNQAARALYSATLYSEDYAYHYRRLQESSA